MNRLFGMFLLTLLNVSVMMSAPLDDKVQGQVKERSSQHPIEYATVALHEADSGKLVTGAITDSTGCFHLEGVAQGRYYIECSFVGFNSLKTPTFDVGDGRKTDVGTLWMNDAGRQLAEVAVAGHRSTFTAKLDRKVYNVGEDLLSTSGSASDLMQNIPSVEVDIDGAVSLRGNENVTILVNGKPSAMMSAKTRGDALNQLSASNIERIEVITNPSAEHKPDGVSGIINIVLKKDAPIGSNATFTANAGNRGRYNAGVNMNVGLKHVNLFGGYTFRCDRYDRTTTDHRTSPTHIINQSTYGLGHPVSHTFCLGAIGRLSQHDEVEVAGNYNHRSFKRDERVESETTDEQHQLTDFYLRYRDALAYENMWEGTFRYTHTYGNGNEWGVDYTYSSESEDEMNHYSTQRNHVESLNNEEVWDANYLHIATLHWKHQFGNQLKLSVGYEMEHSQAEQNYHLSDWNGASFIADAENSTDFTHVRLLNTLYTTAALPLGQWSLLAGLRGEWAHLENKLISMHQSSTQHYAHLYPTMHASYRIDDHNEWQLNYSLRVNRPEGDDMNPFTERINPLSLKAGNPHLKPEQIHSLETAWLWHDDYGTSLMCTLYYRYLTHEITSVSRYIEDGVLLTTKENLSSSQSAGAELIWTQNVSRWLSFNCNLNGYYNQINAERLGFGRNKSTFSWSSLLSADFMPFPHAMIQLNACYRSPRLVPQGQRDGDCRINLGVKYDIPKFNLSLLASVTDLLDTYRKSFTLDTPQLKQKVESRRNPRIFYIGVSYQLGKSKKKNQATLEYDENM